MPTQAELNRLFHFEPESGALFWKVTNSRRNKAGNEAGHQQLNGRVVVRCNKRLCYRSRIVWTMHNGLIPLNFVIDHINHKTFDDRLSNLRLVTKSQNQRNLSLQKRNRSGQIGISYVPYKKLWRVRLHFRREGKLTEVQRIAHSLARAIEVRDALYTHYGFHPNHGQMVQ